MALQMYSILSTQLFLFPPSPYLNKGCLAVNLNKSPLFVLILLTSSPKKFDTFTKKVDGLSCSRSA